MQQIFVFRFGPNQVRARHGGILPAARALARRKVHKRCLGLKLQHVF